MRQPKPHADNSPIRHSRLFCTRWNGLDKSGGIIDALDSAEYSGSLIILLNEGVGFVKRNMKTRWKKTPNSRIEMPEYCERSVFEALVNALIHRDYLMLGSELNTILNHTEVYHIKKGKLILHLRYDFESNAFCDTIGQRLRYYRQLKGYSTRQLAEAVNVVPATIMLYENDKHPIKYKTAVAIAEVLEIDRTLLIDDYTTFVDYPCNELLQELRKALNLNQSEIAAKIGVAQSNYSAWERGIKTPRKQEYKNILPLLQKSNIKL